MDSDNIDTDVDTDTEMEEDTARPQPMAGFRVGQKRKAWRDEAAAAGAEQPPDMRRTVSAPPVLAPLASASGWAGAQGGYDPDTLRPCVYFPAQVDMETLVDWRRVTEENNNQDPGDTDPELSKAALVRVNNKEVAVFKYGDQAIATASRCPHAGGPLHLGDIEVLPDRSLCVRCPWHKWAFRVGSRRGQGSQEGECVFPPGRDDKSLAVFPTLVDTRRKQIKIGFDSFDAGTLVNETF